MKGSEDIYSDERTIQNGIRARRRILEALEEVKRRHCPRSGGKVDF